MKKFILSIFLFSSLFAQAYDTLYLPDSLGGCADLYKLIFNPIMDRIYIWSDRSDNMGVLDCVSGERLKPIHSIPPNADMNNHTIFAYNPNNNYLYAAPEGRTEDSIALVIDCSTQVIIDTLLLPFREEYGTPSFTLNIPANKIFWTTNRQYGSDIESTYTYIFDGRTNQVLNRVRTNYRVIQHQSRKIAYSYPNYYYPDIPIYVIDAENDTISDSIVPPASFCYCEVLLSSETERLFAVACSSYPCPYNLLRIIDCTTNQVIGELQLPISNWHIDYLVYNSVNNKLYVLGPKIYIIDVNSVQIVDSITRLGDSPIYNPNTNHLYLSDRASSSIKVIDGATNQLIDEILLPCAARNDILDPTLNKLYLDDGFNILIIDCNQRQLERIFKMAYVNEYIMWQPVTNRLYIDDVCRDSFSSIFTVYDANTHLPIKILDLSDYVPPGEWFFHFTTATQVNKIYLASGGYGQGIYVLDGNTDSLINLISCEVGGDYLLYNPNQNKLYAIPFTYFVSGYIYIIDCNNDVIRNVINVGESGNGYFNPYNDKVYATISYETGPEFKVFVIDGIGDTVIRVLDSLGLPLAFRNKGDIHQIYIGSVYKDCIYALDATTDSIVDSVMNVPVLAFDDQFFYYDSIDDRIYYPKEFGVLVIDCLTNNVMDTIILPSILGLPRFPEESFWHPVSNRFYTRGCLDNPSYCYCPVYIIDCRTNTIIDSCHLLASDIMQWNSINNVIYVNDHWRSKVLAIRDDLISIEEKESVRIIKELLIYPTIGNKFIIKRKIDEEMRIYDVCGRIVKRIGKKETIIDGRNLSPGVYFVRVDKPKTKDTQKFIVVK